MSSPQYDYNPRWVERQAAFVRSRRKRSSRAPVRSARVQQWHDEANAAEQNLAEYLARHGQSVEDIDLCRDLARPAGPAQDDLFGGAA